MITVTNTESASADYFFVCFYTETKPPEAITMTTTVTVTQSPTVEDTPILMNPPTSGT